ncbi:MAG: hypothetical protein MI975_16905, partial [Cytophagales bacterium]|nr:hypothetical protein [Cytophagales bacterium]
TFTLWNTQFHELYSPIQGAHKVPYCIAGFGGVPTPDLASSFRPRGQERAPKSATQHALNR